MSYLPTRRLFVASLILSALALALLIACSPAITTAPTAVPTAPPPSPTPLPRGGNLTLRLAEDLADLRPWQPRTRGEEQVISLVYNGLTRLDPQLRPQPDLAERWEASQDGRLITFTLRTDVAWHDGRPLSAEDVAFTIDALRALTPTNALLADMERVAQVSTPTSTTVVLALTERYAPIFANLAVPVLPRHLLEGEDLAELNLWEKPVGTGPFKLAERRAGQAIVLEANAAFYRGQPLLDRVVFALAPDAQVADDALRDGRLLLAELPWNEARVADQTIPGVQIGLYPENAYYFLAYNLREGRPFADPLLRRALASAVDLPALVREVTDGAGVPIGNSASPRSWGDLVAPITATADLERAGALLDEAGWTASDDGTRARDGEPLTARIFVRGDDPRRVRAAELIAEAAGTVGISITVERADFETVIKSKYAPPFDFDMLLGSWSNGPGDPDFPDYLFYDPSDFALFHSSQINQGASDARPTLNFVAFRDAAYDNQAAAARQLYDLEQRRGALRLAQQRVAELQPYLFLWADQVPVVLSPQVTTLDGPVNLDTPLYLWNIERWYLSEGEARP